MNSEESVKWHQRCNQQNGKLLGFEIHFCSYCKAITPMDCSPPITKANFFPRGWKLFCLLTLMPGIAESFTDTSLDRVSVLRCFHPVDIIVWKSSLPSDSLFPFTQLFPLIKSVSRGTQTNTSYLDSPVWLSLYLLLHLHLILHFLWYIHL